MTPGHALCVLVFAGVLLFAVAEVAFTLWRDAAAIGRALAAREDCDD